MLHCLGTIKEDFYPFVILMSENNELSERELDILRLVATGASNKEIAQELYISSNTVKVHLRNIFAKIDVASRTEAAMYAVQHGYVDTTNQVSDGSLVVVDSGYEHTHSEPKSRVQPLVLWSVLVVVILLVFAAVIYVTFNRSNQMAITNSPVPTELPRWEIRSPMPTARYGFATVAYESMIYAIAGEDEMEVLGTVERYNPETDSWDVFTEKPVPVSDVQGAVIGGKIYIPGGRMDSGEIATVLEIYNPRDDIWELGAPLPVPVSAYALSAFEGKLYLFGGWDGEQYLDSVYGYDPTLDQWTEESSMPIRRGYAGASVSGGRIYITGGYNEVDKELALNQVYEPDKTESGEYPWTEAAPLPVPLYAFGMTSTADLIYVFGGKSGENIGGSMFHYLPSEDSWVALDSPYEQNPSNQGVVSLETFVYTLGGEINDLPINENRSYQAMYTVVIPLVR